MSNYTMAGSVAAGPLSVSEINLGAWSSETNKLPNKKISFDVHTAHGGYVIKVSTGYGNEGEMYVIDDSKDLGQELGKIVTHHTLAKS
jgi:hypothetical protein